MTVKELIEFLQTRPADLPVIWQDEGDAITPTSDDCRYYIDHPLVLEDSTKVVVLDGIIIGRVP